MPTLRRRSKRFNRFVVALAYKGLGALDLACTAEVFGPPEVPPDWICGCTSFGESTAPRRSTRLRAGSSYRRTATVVRRSFSITPSMDAGGVDCLRCWSVCK